MKITKISILVITCISLGLGIGYKSHKPRTEYIYVKPVLQQVTIDDPRLVKAIIKVESRGNPKAVSSKKCVGLMQIDYKGWRKELKKIGITHREQLFNPDMNVKAGKHILGIYYKEANGNLEQALRDYSGNTKWYAERVLYYDLSEGEIK